ncbi:MAG TPA: hypothetical protein VFY48_08610 [Solirubrobacterales bacterium]|nr:hypothetical protein [Solirubrobacterales bacterium]
MHKVLLAMVMAIALVALAGCGGSDDDGGEEALTKVEFIEQGDAICTKAEDQAETEAEEFAEENGFNLEKATDEELEEAVAEVLVPALGQQAEEIDALAAPEGDEETVEEIVVALEDGTADVEDDPSVVFEGSPLKEASQLAKAYGFKVCGEE